MSVVYVVTPVALLLVIAAIVAFVWAARHGQWDDTTTPGIRAVLDDEARPAAGAPPGAAGPGPDPPPSPQARGV